MSEIGQKRSPCSVRAQIRLTKQRAAAKHWLSVAILMIGSSRGDGRCAWPGLRQGVEGKGSFTSVARMSNLLVWLEVRSSERAWLVSHENSTHSCLALFHHS